MPAQFGPKASMPSSITIPLFALRHKQIGGTEFAIYNLIKGLASSPIQTTVVYDRADHLSPEFRQWLGRTSAVERRSAFDWGGPKNIRFLQETLFEWFRHDGDWSLYPNYFVPPAQPLRPHRSSAVILHDIQYKVLPGYHSQKRRAWLDLYLPWMFRRADSVILISQSEKNYVEEFFGSGCADKCDVVYNAIDWERFETSSQSAPAAALANLLAYPYILSVCHQFPHKNLETSPEGLRLHCGFRSRYLLVSRWSRFQFKSAIHRHAVVERSKGSGEATRVPIRRGPRLSVSTSQAFRVAFSLRGLWHARG